MAASNSALARRQKHQQHMFTLADFIVAAAERKFAISKPEVATALPNHDDFTDLVRTGMLETWDIHLSDHQILGPISLSGLPPVWSSSQLVCLSQM